MNKSHNGKTHVTGARKPSIPTLTVIKGKNEGKEYWLKKNETSIGRSPECDIVVSDDNVSRKHARIVYIGNTFFIYDNESLNGTFLNGSKIIEAQIKSGDIIKTGDTQLKFEFRKDTVEKETLPSNYKKSPDEISESIRGKISEKPSDKRLRLYGMAAATVLILILGIIYLNKEKTKTPIDTKTSIKTPYITYTPEPLKTETATTNSEDLSQEPDAAKYYSQGLLSMMSGNYKDAISSFEKSLKTDPEHEGAAIKLKKCKELFRQTIENLYRAGVREYEILYYDRAILQWTKVMTLTKDFDEVMYKKAKDRIEEAKKRIKNKKR